MASPLPLNVNDHIIAFGIEIRNGTIANPPTRQTKEKAFRNISRSREGRNSMAKSLDKAIIPSINGNNQATIEQGGVFAIAFIAIPSGPCGGRCWMVGDVALEQMLACEGQQSMEPGTSFVGYNLQSYAPTSKGNYPLS